VTPAVHAWAELLTDGPVTPSVLDLAAVMAAQHGAPHRTTEEPPAMAKPNPQTVPQRMAATAARIIADRGEVLTVDLVRAGFTPDDIRQHGQGAIATAVQRTGAVVLNEAA
jgi:hypothetical protein